MTLPFHCAMVLVHVYVALVRGKHFKGEDAPVC